MNPVIVIPTFVSVRRNREDISVITTYDHTTLLTERGELSRCLEALQGVEGVGQILVLVASEPSIQEQAADKVQSIVDGFPSMSIAVIGSTELSLVYQRMDALGIGGYTYEVGLSGYAAIRNLGVLLAGTLGFDAVVFLDDDVVVEDPGFLKRAMYGLGKLTRKGIPILAKTGYYLNEKGSYLSLHQNKWYNRFWQQGKAFNAWINKAMHGPRLSRSNHVCGGCLAIHKEAFIRVAFDPWIPRGEDLDYMLNLRMYGSDIWFDNKWWMRHLPPGSKSEGARFRQDIYRWLYEYRKMEYSRTQIDLLQVKPASLEPYPGPFLEPGIGRRIRITALLRSLGGPDKKGYRGAARAARVDAEEYAQNNCMRYFEFQSVWPEIMARLENDNTLRTALVEAVEQRTFGTIDPASLEAFAAKQPQEATDQEKFTAPETDDRITYREVRTAGEGDPAGDVVRSAERPTSNSGIQRPQRRVRQVPAYTRPDAFSIDPGMTGEIQLNLGE